MPPDPADRIAKASPRAEGLAAFAESAGRLGRLLKQARQESDPAKAAALASELEGRLRLAEEDLRDLAGVPPDALSGREGAPVAVPLQEETLRWMIRELAETLARRPETPDSLQPLRERLDKLEAGVGDGGQRLTDSLRAEHRQASLDLETLERQIASIEAGMGTLQDRLQAVEARPEPSAAAPAAGPAPDATAFLGQVKELVQQAVSESFSFPDLGALVDQKVSQRAESMRVEIRELEAALVKAIMQQLETKPLGEAQVEALVDQRVNQLLLKYIQR